MSKIREAKLQALLEECHQFLELVPLSAIQKGNRWMPSEETIELGLHVKDSLHQLLESQMYRRHNL